MEPGNWHKSSLIAMAAIISPVLKEGNPPQVSGVPLPKGEGLSACSPCKNIARTRTARRKVLGLLVDGNKPQEISTLKEITPLGLTFL